MKITELINVLEAQRAAHGEVDVVLSLGQDWHGMGVHTDRIEVLDTWSGGPELPVEAVVIGRPIA